QTRDDSLHNGFRRYEHDLGEHTQSYIGLGYTERAPDYWELFNKETPTSISAFDSVKPEKTTQIDVGVSHQQGPWDTFASAYLSQVQDYVLIQSNVVKGMRTATVARNVDARTWGAEVGAHYKVTPQWTALGSLAYVNGQNRTDDRALGQIPPLEARLGLNWQRGAWSAGSLLRLVASQHRYAVNEGNIVGQDLGRTGGFGIASLHGGYAWSKTVKLSAGIDNLFDKTYAEAISRGGANVSGYDTTFRINEPGRTAWLKVQVALD
ncbi:MAG: TonB-dependent receptor, partial [Aquabacterium sp.]